MDIAQTHEWVRAVMAIGGALSIYLGYRLFCDIAFQKPARRSILLTNMASGALLALFGLGILVAEVRGIAVAAHYRHPDWQKKSSEERSLEAPKLNKGTQAMDRLV